CVIAHRSGAVAGTLFDIVEKVLLYDESINVNIAPDLSIFIVMLFFLAGLPAQLFLWWTAARVLAEDDAVEVSQVGVAIGLFILIVLFPIGVWRLRPRLAQVLNEADGPAPLSPPAKSP
ncbi:MAG: hypothetical protein MI723_09690, partial [Caulobacterales bacterium]|nr:hypothetical protein [Caulobacterales bacterium]